MRTNLYLRIALKHNLKYEEATFLEEESILGDRTKHGEIHILGKDYHGLKKNKS
jgi:hypothetical protein